VLDYQKALGHTEAFTINDDGTTSPATSPKDEWAAITSPS
jgi:hypothetical protein